MIHPSLFQWVFWWILVGFAGFNLIVIVKRQSLSQLIIWVLYTAPIFFGGFWGVVSILDFLAPIHFLFLRKLNAPVSITIGGYFKKTGVLLFFFLASYFLSAYTKNTIGLGKEGFTFFVDSIFYSQIAHLISFTGIESAYVGQLNAWFGEQAMPTPYHYPEIWAAKLLAPIFGLSILTFFDFWLHGIILSILAFVFYTQSSIQRPINILWALTLAWITPGLFTYLLPESFPAWFNNLPANDTRPFYFPASRVGGIKNAVLAITGVFFVKSIIDKNHDRLAYWGAASIVLSIAIAPLVAITLALIWLINPRLKSLIGIAQFFIPVIAGLVAIYFISPESNLPIAELPKNPLYFENQSLNPGFLFRSIWLGASQINSIFFWPFAILLIFILGFKVQLGNRFTLFLGAACFITAQIFPAASLLGPIQAFPWLIVGYLIYKYYGHGHFYAFIGLIVSLLALAYLPALLPKVMDIWQLFNLSFSFLLLPCVFFLGDRLISQIHQNRLKSYAWIGCMILLLFNSSWINRNAEIGVTTTHLPDGILNRVENLNAPVKSVFFATPTNSGHLYVDMQGEEILAFTNNWTTSPGAGFDDFPGGFNAEFTGKSNPQSLTMPLIKFASRNRGLNREQCLTAFVKEKKIDWVYRQHQYSFNKMGFLIPAGTDSLNYPKGGYTVYFLSDKQ